jgi:hypothetical protein
MKKTNVFLFVVILFSIWSCNKDETTNANCTTCTGAVMGENYKTTYCSGDTLLMLYKEDGTFSRSQSFKASVDSFKKFATQRYGMTCK